MSQQHPKHGGIRWVSEGHGADKQCPIDASAKYIDPNGMVVEVPLANGSNIPRTRNLYRPFIEGVKEKKGWRRWESFASDEERNAYIASKRAPYADRQRRSARAFETRQEQAIRSAQDSAAAMNNMAATMRDYIEAQDGAKEQTGGRKGR